MNNRINIIKGKIWIESSCLNPQQISNFIGCEATRSQIKGDLNSGGKPFKTNYWEYNFESVAVDEWDVLKEKILSYVNKNKIGFQEVLDHNNGMAYVAIIVKESEFHVGIEFSPSELLELCQLGLGLEINLYQ